MIRKAAEDLNITSSPLNRRILAFEAEFGAQIFERLARGVRLNPAGKLLMHHIRSRVGDLERVSSQVVDLSGARRGHVSIACSQAVNPVFLLDQIARYRSQHRAVTFSVSLRDRAAAERELSNFSSDLALVFEPVHLADFEVIKAIPQALCAVMAADHPLASRPGLRLLRLPRRASRRPLRGIWRPPPARARHARSLPPCLPPSKLRDDRQYVLYEQVVSFQIPIGLPTADPRRARFSSATSGPASSSVSSAAAPSPSPPPSSPNSRLRPSKRSETAPRLPARSAGCLHCG